MMRLACFLVVCFAAAATAFGRLGDTLDQAEARYGLEKTRPLPGGTVKLLEGSREMVFEFEGWRIRCALLQATDGQFYVVREEYMKIFNGEVMKAGGTPQIHDFERDAVFKGEGGEWSSKSLAELGNDLISTAGNQFVRILGITKVWVRPDGAMARTNLSALNIILDLPQARKYEAELHGIKDQNQQQQAQRLYQQQPQDLLSASPAPIQKNEIKTTRQFNRVQSSILPFQGAVKSNSEPRIIRPNPFAALVPLLTLIGMGGLAIIIVRVAAGLSRRPKRLQPRSSGTSTASIPPPLPPTGSAPRTMKDLTWDEFELLVGEIYRRQGYTVELSAGTGADGGVDLVLHRDRQRILVQCKSWNVYKVAAPAIREFYGVLVAEKADCGIFITTGQFTRDAKEFAEDKPMELLDGPAFQSLLQNASTDPNDDLLNVALWAPLFLAASKVTIPPCPFCKTTMVKREGRAGAFFGCPTYPRCRGKREIRKHVIL